MYIPEDFIERLLNTVSIVEVIQKRTQVERRGGAYMAKCPFHKGGQEKNASMKIYEETGTYHCFTCSETGNAISFLKNYDNKEFIEAVEELALIAGLEIPKQKTKIDTSNATKINNKAAKIFYEQLKSNLGAKTVKYLQEREISGETAKFFQLGYSSNKKPSLYEILKNEFKEIDLDESGLFGKSDDGEYYDRFRDRLMFPIRNIKGECIAFGGRLLSDKKGQAKYLNSPETKTYKKKYELYGLYEIREINKRPESIFLVEGYMDVIGLFQNGIKNAVASSGTAFTPEQLRKILNYTNNIYIVFDGDEAGHKASWRAVENALPLLREDTRISFIFLKPDEDPDSYVRSNGKDAFLNLAKEAKSFSDFFFEYVKKQDDFSTLEGRSSAAKFALPLIKKITNNTLKEFYINEASKIFDLDFSNLIQGEKKSKQFSPSKKEVVKKSNDTVLRKSVLGIFMALTQHPILSSMTEFSLIANDSKFNFINDIRNLYKNSPDSNPSIFLEKIRNEKIKNIFGEALVSEITLSEEDATSMIKDCLKIISQKDLNREEILKEKYNMQELTSAEKRELQQIILKKDKMSQDEEALIKNLSSI